MNIILFITSLIKLLVVIIVFKKKNNDFFSGKYLMLFGVILEIAFLTIYSIILPDTNNIWHLFFYSDFVNIIYYSSFFMFPLGILIYVKKLNT